MKKQNHQLFNDSCSSSSSVDASAPSTRDCRSPSLVSSDEEENAKIDSQAVTTSADGDVDVMLHHEDFTELLTVALKIQTLHSMILESTGQPWTSQQYLPSSSLTAEETFRATLNLQDHSNSSAVRRTKVRRGDYPITDALMDDSLRVLKQESDDMFCFRFTPPSMRAGLANRSKDKATTKPTRKRTRSPKKKEGSSVLSFMLKATVHQPPEVIVVDDNDIEPQLIPEASIVPVQHHHQNFSTTTSAIPAIMNASDLPQGADSAHDYSFPLSIFDDDEFCGKCKDDYELELLQEFSDVSPPNDVHDSCEYPAFIDESHFSRPTKRPRTSSFDDLDLGSETMESWANQLGLSLE
jgi:hypothetical protein